MKAFAQAGIILALSAVLAAASYLARPEVLPWDRGELEVELEEALGWEQAIWLDARVEEDFRRGSYQGALPMNEENWESGLAPFLDQWTPERPVVVFCSSQSCLRSDSVARRLRSELGVENVYSLAGGWEAMVDAGLIDR
ncbi:rhodanese-like domain-containing protein [Pelagicoccus sp. SDUM812003]|uniref:rhodanese-like domain-containing protein n=1 Tax=Pelagicoccus sp. SDUM812003 TaxID=3041267 RepID=UPI00280EBBB3|nr:rhodanese-like domain-containing protein [Pelagicoccus sp. SDUM812003]MDQ8202442.1 rhodanese-like domain-containing protein [Pelagicoccus sp. SDUM812003]